MISQLWTMEAILSLTKTKEARNKKIQHKLRNSVPHRTKEKKKGLKNQVVLRFLNRKIINPEALVKIGKIPAAMMICLRNLVIC